MRKDGPKAERPAGKRKPPAKYSTPRLIRYGTVRELTKGSTSRTNDPGGPQNGRF